MSQSDEGLKRALANSVNDYERLRKQVEQRVEQAAREGEDTAIEHLLEPLDNLHRAIAELQNVRGHVTKKMVGEALDLVSRSFDSVLRQMEVERVDATGQPYDAETMLAVGKQLANGVPAGHVAGQVRPAYKRAGKLLREAQVVVADEVDDGAS